MTNEIKSGEEKRKRFNKSFLKQKFSAFIDGLILLSSVWITIILIFHFQDFFSDLSYTIYKILLYILIFFLIYATLDFLKLFISSALVLGIIFLLLLAFYEIYDNPQPYKYFFEETNYNVSSNPYPEEIKIEIISFKSDIYNTLDSLKSELDTVRYELKKYQALNEDSVVSEEKIKLHEKKDKLEES